MFAGGERTLSWRAQSGGGTASDTRSPERSAGSLGAAAFWRCFLAAFVEGIIAGRVLWAEDHGHLVLVTDTFPQITPLQDVFLHSTCRPPVAQRLAGRLGWGCPGLCRCGWTCAVLGQVSCGQELRPELPPATSLGLCGLDVGGASRLLGGAGPF